MRMLLAAISTLPLIAFTGCALQTTAGPASETASAGFQGTVFGGQQPVTGATVTVYAVGTSGYGSGSTALASTTTDSTGFFSFPSSGAGSYTCPYSNTPLYLVATGSSTSVPANPNLAMIAGVGACSAAKSSDVNINEVSTVATVFALSGFFNTALGSGQVPTIGGTAAGSGVYNAGLVNAMNNTIPLLVSLFYGTANTGGTVGSTTTKIESAKINTIADILAACVNTTGETSTTETTTLCGQLFNNTRASASSRPSNTIQAALRMALFPYTNVTNLFSLASASPPFVGLTAAPNDWTIGVSYTTPNLGLGIAGTATSRTSSNLDIDQEGRIWIPSNATGSAGVADFDPSTGQFGGPYGSGFTSPQYLAVDQSGLVWASGVSGAYLESIDSNHPASAGTLYGAGQGTAPTGVVRVGNGPTPGGTGSIVFNNGASLFDLYGGAVYLASESYSANATGIAVFPYLGYVGSSGSSAAKLEADGATSGSASACRYEEAYNFSTDTAATIVVSTASPCFSGDVINMTGFDDTLMAASSLNQLCSYAAMTCFVPPVAVSSPEGMALDGLGNVWIANSGNASVSTLAYVSSTGTTADYIATATVPYVHGTGQGGTMTTPFGIAIDASGNVWVSNAGCINTGGGCTPGAFTLSELIGAAAPTVTPLGAQTLRLVGGNYAGGGTRP